jgi:hypothetical protein
LGRGEWWNIAENTFARAPDPDQPVVDERLISDRDRISAQRWRASSDARTVADKLQRRQLGARFAILNKG